MMGDGGTISLGTDAASAVRSVLDNAESAISLSRQDVAFLVLFEDRLRRLSVSVLGGDDLVEIAAIVARAGGTAPVGEAGVTTNVARMVDMRILVRGNGPSRNLPSYRLGSVGREVAEGWRFVPDDEAERLDALLGEAAVRLAEMAAKAEATAAGSRGCWPWTDICTRITRIVGDGMLRPVERRQGQMDRWQSATVTRVQGMLSRDWSEAMDSCEQTLDAALSASREMKACADRSAPRLHDSLQAIAEAAHGKHRETELAAEAVAAVVDRIVDWNTDRLAEWSRFVDQAMAYIRNVVRSDPGRVLSRMVDLQMQAFCAACDEASRDGDDGYVPWTMTASRIMPFTRLRDPDPAAPPRLKLDRVSVPPLVRRDETWDRIDDAVRAHVGHLLATTGQADVIDVLAPWRSEPPARLSRIAGRAVGLMAAMGEPDADPSASGGSGRIPVAAGFEIDSFTVRRGRRGEF